MSTKLLQPPTAELCRFNSAFHLVATTSCGTAGTKLVVSPICECASRQGHPVVSAPSTQRQADTVRSCNVPVAFACEAQSLGVVLGEFMNERGKRGPTPADIRFGHKMRARRMMLGMSQSDLGAALDVTFQQVQKYESGINRVSVSTLEKLAATLRVPITYFFEGHTAENGQADGSGMDLTAFLATPEGFALCTAFQHIESKGMRSAVIDLLQGLQGMATKH
jgi:transcriptional regulator with XRE-family HTH domain